MSGGMGSGSRVSTSTMRHIEQLQRDLQMAADLAAAQQPGDVDAPDLDWEPAESPKDQPEQEDACMQDLPGPTFLDQPEPPKPPCLYENLPDGHVEIRTVYDRGLQLQDQPDARLARGIIRDTFFKSEVSGDLDYNLQWVEIHSNWQVMGVESVLNKPLWAMHKMFGEAYKIDDTRVLYHGSDMAELIAQVGYRGAASKRSKFGKGIYSSSDPWEALSYANGDAANKSEFVVKMLITSVHIGPHTGGWQDRIDFGVDANGKQNLTLTDPTGKIFCSKFENQLLPTAIITMRYMFENPHTRDHQNFVGGCYNVNLWKLIHVPIKPAPIGAGGAGGAGGVGGAAGAVVAAGAAGAAAAPGSKWIEAQHSFWKVSQVVTICNNYGGKYRDYVGCTGVIRKIIAKDQCFFFFVQIALDKDATPVNFKDINTAITKINIGSFVKFEGRDRCCLIVKANCMQDVRDNTTIGAAIAAGTAAWVDSVGAPAVAGGTRSGFAVGAVATDEYADSLHYLHAVGKEVYIEESIMNNKQYHKYSKFVDYRGTIKRIMAKGGKDYIFFVELTHDKDDKPVCKDKTEEELRWRNGGGFKFLQGLDRHFLNCFPAKQTHIQAYNDYTKRRFELMRKKRAADAMLDLSGDQGPAKQGRTQKRAIDDLLDAADHIDAMIDAGDQGGFTKKARPGDDGPAGGAAGKAAAP